jgi:hypothetical protein
MHQWNVWHGTQEKYQIFDTLGGRFNSEFGMEAFPHIDTIRYYVTDPTQLYAQSHMLDFHNKADGHERRIATYLVENFRTDYDNSLSWLAEAMGREEVVWWCAGVAIERLLACHILVYYRLLPTQEARLLCNAQSLGPYRCCSQASSS